MLSLESWIRYARGSSKNSFLNNSNKNLLSIFPPITRNNDANHSPLSFGNIKSEVSVHPNEPIRNDGTTLKYSPFVDNEGFEAKLINLDKSSSAVSSNLNWDPKPEEESSDNEHIVAGASHISSPTQPPLMQIDECRVRTNTPLTITPRTITP